MKVVWRVSAWPFIVARWIHRRYELWFHTNTLNATLMLLSLDYDLFAMALGLVFILVSPLCSFWSSKVAAPRSLNRTGHCRALAIGADIYQCVQAPIHLVCIFLYSHFAIPSSVVCYSHFKMTKEHTWMGCRQGSSQGCVSRQPSSTTSDASSEASDFCCNRYTATRSGRGKGRGQFIIEVHSHHSHSHSSLLLPLYSRKFILHCVSYCRVV